MAFTPEQVAALEAKLDKANVKTRTQAGKTLSYVEGWKAIEEANRIFGFHAWDRETVRLEETNRDLVTLTGQNGPYQQWRVGYLAVVRIVVDADGRQIIRNGTGFGSGMGKPEALGDAVESAIKEAETDAMKRALMTFGYPFGLALYDKDRANVETSPQKVMTSAPKVGTSTPSISERAAPKGPAPDSDRHNNLEDRIVTTTIAAMKMAKSVKEFDDWKAHPDTRATFRDLSKAGQEIILQEGRKLREALDQVALVAA